MAAPPPVSNAGSDTATDPDTDPDTDEADYGLFDLGEADAPASPSPAARTLTASASARIERIESTSDLLLMRRVGSSLFSSCLDLHEFELCREMEVPASPGPGGGRDLPREAPAKLPPASPVWDPDLAIPSPQAGSSSTSSSDPPRHPPRRRPARRARVPLPDVAEVTWNIADVLYHDIMMSVLSYLPASDLAAYSTAGVRPNFDVSYYLRLQLEGAIQTAATAEATGTATAAAARSAANGSGVLGRLARLDLGCAEDLVDRYVRGEVRGGPGAGAGPDAALLALQERMSHATLTEKGAAASCAAFSLAVLGKGAATTFSLMASSTAAAAASSDHLLPPQAALLGMAGFGIAATRYAAERAVQKQHAEGVDGAGAGAVHSGAEGGRDGAASRMAKKMQAILMTLPSHGEEGKGLLPLQIVERLAGRQFRGTASTGDSEGEGQAEELAGEGRRDKWTRQAASTPFSANPYEHLEDEHLAGAAAGGRGTGDRTNALDDGEGKSQDISDGPERAGPMGRRRRPSGCIGAYAQVLRMATEAAADRIRTARREAFARLPAEEQARHTSTLIDACASDANLEMVQDLVRNVGIDVNGFHVGSDGITETCILHTAAFNGATEVVRFLCSGIDERDPSRDGGLCDVDLVDENGWTALHFAAGADSVETVRVLASFGVRMTIEAANGYTPYHWAERLSNTDVADELRRLRADDRFMMPTPLAFFANRFFAMIPTAVATHG